MSQAPVTMPRLQRALHVMAKPTGAICNLDCEYCFFLSKEELYPGSSFRMTEQVLTEYVRQLLEAQRGVDEVVFAFQGGEPTMMGLDFFNLVLDVQSDYAVPGQRILNTIQTNGTLLTTEWGKFLKDHDFLVGLSIDGPRELHDVYRVDKGGKPTFDRVIAGLEVLKKHGVDWNALVTVNAVNADHGREVYTFLRDELGATFIQLIPIVERERAHQASSRSVSGEQYGRFLNEVFDEWVRNDVGDVFVQNFDTALGHWMGMDDFGSCVHAPTCGRAVALEHNGDVYSCDHYVDPEYRLGNITDLASGKQLLALVDSPQQIAFGQAKRDTLPDYCKHCDVLFACNGGCPKDRFLQTPSGEPGLHYLCEGYQAFFRHVDQPMRIMAELLRTGRDADGVKAHYAS
jgi:uncharacterized protein